MIIPRLNIIGGCVGSSGGVPFKKDTLFIIDGTIIESEGGYYFQDKSGNDRHFLITGLDWADRIANGVKGFPYKSAATISAPAADATLIAADINNFLYDSGGTPNQIPVVSLFQDVDYEHKLFCKHIGQVLDLITGVELQEPYVSTIVLYNTVKTGADLVSCQSYFVVPEEVATAKWGGTGETYATIQAALTAVSAGGTIYVKSGAYSPVDKYDLTKIGVSIIGIGNCTITKGTYSYIIQNGITNSIIKGFVINGSGGSLLINNSGDITFNKCKYLAANGRIVYHRATSLTSINCIYVATGTAYFDNQKSFYSYGDLFTGSSSVALIKLSTNTGQECVIEHSKFTLTVNNYFDSQAAFIFKLFNCSFSQTTVVSLAVALYSPSVNIGYCDFNFTTNSASSLITNSTSTADIDIYNNRFEITNANRILFISNCNYANITNNAIVLDTMTLSGASVILIYKSTLQSSIINNYIHIGSVAVSGEGYGIQIGDSLSDLDFDLLVENNNIIFDDSPHAGIFNWRANGVIVRYNKISVTGGAGAIISKGNSSDFLNSPVSYNICNYKILSKGASNQLIYNNTIVSTIGVHIMNNDNVLYPAENNTIKNNIIIANGESSNTIWIQNSESLTGLVIDYNIYYSTNPTPFNYLGTLKTFVEWQALGFDTNSKLLTETQFNNLFTDYDNGDYSLPIGSLAIGIGANLGNDYREGLDSTTDWGSDTEIPTVVTKLQGDDWDCGAYIH